MNNVVKNYTQVKSVIIMRGLLLLLLLLLLFVCFLLYLVVMVDWLGRIDSVS